MKTFFSLLLVIVFLTTFSLSSIAKPVEMIYKLSVQLNPELNSITGVAEIDQPVDLVFLLSKGLSIQSILSNGKPVSFAQEVSNINPNSVEITLKEKCKKISISYSGKLNTNDFPQTISNSNRMNERMFELTDLLDWYPRMKNGSRFSYTLTLNVPSNFGLITNGELEKQIETDGRKVEEWRSIKPVYAISLLGSIGLKKSEAETNGYSLEIYYSKLPDSYIDSMKVDLVHTVQLYANLYQSTGSNNLIRIIYSPRPAGGYARGGLIVVSEEFALEQRNNKYGFARDFHLNAHEIAHLWSKARTDTPDDWINEGLAEYSAFMASEKIIGNDFSDLLREEYLGIIENTATQNSILETTNDSWERDINRYYKPTILLDSIRQKCGEITIFQLIRSLDATFRSHKTATTWIFLDVLRQTTGSGTQGSFYNSLNRKQWSKKQENSRNCAYDPVFIGTWTGALTQFGATTKFVLNLKKNENGELVPSLDSPDQNAYGIPASDLFIDGNKIFYKVGVASAVYSGILNRETMAINGTWKQRGVDYSLDLLRK